MNALQTQFMQEGRELLEGIGETLLAWEKTPEDESTLQALFRLVHTLKGNTGLFDELRPIGQVLHAAEDCLDSAREGHFCLNSSASDLLLEAMDLVASALDSWEQGTYDSEEWQTKAGPLSQSIRALMNALQAGPVAVVDQLMGKSDVTDSAPPEWAKLAMAQLHAEDCVWVCVRYQPEPECFFKGEDPFQLACSVPELRGLNIVPPVQGFDFEQMDVYDCKLGLVLVSAAPLSDVLRVFECIPEQIEALEWSAAVGAAVSNSPQDLPALDPGKRQLALQIWRLQGKVLSALEVDQVWQGKAESVVKAIEGLSSSLGRPQWAMAAKAAMEAAIHQGGAAPLVQWLANPPAELLQEQPAVVAVNNPAPPQVIQPEANVARGLSGHTPAAASAEPEHRVASTLKVSREKVDRLMELIGEMVVAKNALPYLAQKAEVQFGVRELARELKTHYGVINRIAEEMQDAIMQVRMLPVGSVFQRFPRLVRDLSKKLDKRVRLEISGEDTEADKNMIEALSEPLIHLLRNSLDHGIEPPEDRVAAGKPEEGCIHIHAWQEGDRVQIQIRDDGAGIDAERVKAKALERGLIAAERAATMSTQEIQQLIFMPGFSTAAAVSDVSGRGVGMDVVRSAVMRVNGQIDLKSELGVGTEIVLSLPLTMAVTNVMMIETGGQRYGVPMDVVVETVRVPASAIHTIQRQQATVLRGKIVPLLSLNRLLQLDQAQRTNEDQEFAVLVVKCAGETVGVVVDDFESTVDILLRPLEGVLASLPIYCGSALLGDGTVLLVLNCAEVIACQSC